MAKKDTSPKFNKKKINDLVNNIQGGMDFLYRNTYITTPQNKKSLYYIKDDITKSIDNIINVNKSATGRNSISSLYANNNEKGNEEENDLTKLLSNEALTDSIISQFNENQTIIEYDSEIDNCCKYMPTLEDALDAKKDNVLTADHFSKDFLNIVDPSNSVESELFNKRVKDLVKKYALDEFLEESYDNTQKYGEDFVNIIGYNKAFNRLLTNKTQAGSCFIQESYIDDIVDGELEFKIPITESGYKDYCSNNTIDYDPKAVDNFQMESIKLIINTTGCVTEAVKSCGRTRKVLNEINSKFSTTMEKTIPDKLELPDKANSSSQDGFVDKTNISNSADAEKVNVPGAILRRLPRENVIPIYMDQVNLGFYYLEYKYSEIFSKSGFDAMGGLSARTHIRNNNLQSNQRDALMMYISSKLSEKIDSAFINNNQNMKEEIYCILKANERNTNKTINELKVTYIPPEDMVHFYFKMDPKTHRGISDLDKALIPAKMYCSLYTSSWTGVLTRGFDKRVYYVNQTVDTNISKVLLNTINQLKKSNFGNREVPSLKNLLNITGRNQDLLIPRSASGEAPFSVEVMQGQDIDIKNDLLDILENMAINATDVPYDYIQSRKNTDYAVRLTMSSGKFLRKVFKRQARTQDLFNPVVTKLWNYEYEDGESRRELEVKLPPPSFLTLLNTNQVISSTKENVDVLTETEYPEEDTDQALKNIFKKLMMESMLNGYLDMANINDIKDKALIEYRKIKDEEENEA